jgi:hypothetical protein
MLITVLAPEHGRQDINNVLRRIVVVSPPTIILLNSSVKQARERTHITQIVRYVFPSHPQTFLPLVDNMSHGTRYSAAFSDF